MKTNQRAHKRVIERRESLAEVAERKRRSELLAVQSDLSAALEVEKFQKLRIEELESELASIRASLQTTVEQLAAATKTSVLAHRQLSEIRASLAWRMTARFRDISDIWRTRKQARSWLLGSLVRVAATRYAALPARQRIKIKGFLLRRTPVIHNTLVALLRGNASPELPAAPVGPIHAGASLVESLDYRLGFWRLYRDLSAHQAKLGPVSHIIALPFFATGGAELTASNFAVAAARPPKNSVLLLAADRPLDGASRLPPPPGTSMLELSHFFPGADANDREALLFGVVRAISPRVFHNINSEAGWRTIIHKGARLKAICRLYGSIFAFQFDPKTGERVGYAETFLRRAMPNLNGLFSDNQRFLTDSAAIYNLSSAYRRMHAIYNPVRVPIQQVGDGIDQRERAFIESMRSRSRLQVLWAGRLDEEKRPDLLFEVARRTAADFHVYGSRTVDQTKISLADVPSNVHFHGHYTSPLDVARAREHHVFMFTSRWEGMPNSVIEFGALGFPVVAPTVGGVGELIERRTGYPLPERPLADDYIRAFTEIAGSPADAAKRSRRLVKRIAERHTGEKFAASLASVEGYVG